MLPSTFTGTHTAEHAPPRAAQVRAGVELLAVGERERLAPAHGDAVAGRLDQAGAVVADAGGADQVGPARVGEQQLDRSVRRAAAQGAVDDVERRLLVLGHVERAGEPALELLARRLGRACGLALGGPARCSPRSSAGAAGRRRRARATREHDVHRRRPGPPSRPAPARSRTFTTTVEPTRKPPSPIEADLERVADRVPPRAQSGLAAPMSHALGSCASSSSRKLRTSSDSADPPAATSPGPPRPGGVAPARHGLRADRPRRVLGAA